MMGNSEKMVFIPSADPNQWSQNNQIDDQKGGCLNNNMGSVGGRVMDQKTSEIAQDHDHHDHQQQQQQQQQQKLQNLEPLRCPRCDSTNTKFCYYNNYSLSQPRHFCKACKRYWTRGGTLRNVPVGGGCRKNKRVRRSSNNNTSSSSSLTNSSLDHANSANSTSSNGQIHHDLLSSASNHVNPLFYGLSTSHNPSSDINFPFSRYDLQNPPQINGLGLGFPNMNVDDGEFRNNGLGGSRTFQDLISSNPLISNYTNSTTTNRNSPSPSISSLLASSLQIKGSNNFQTLLPSYEDGQATGGGGMFMKEVKMELEGQNRQMGHHQWSAPSQNQMDQTMGSSSHDPSVLWSNGANNFGAWLDPSSNNIGSSVPSLI